MKIYWQDVSTITAIPSTFTTDIVRQHNKTGDISFRALLYICIYCNYYSIKAKYIIKRKYRPKGSFTLP